MSGYPHLNCVGGCYRTLYIQMLIFVSRDLVIVQMLVYGQASPVSILRKNCFSIISDWLKKELIKGPERDREVGEERNMCRDYEEGPGGFATRSPGENSQKDTLGPDQARAKCKYR